MIQKSKRTVRPHMRRKTLSCSATTQALVYQMVEKLREIKPDYGRDELVDFLVKYALPQLEKLLMGVMNEQKASVNFILTYKPGCLGEIITESDNDGSINNIPSKSAKMIVQSKQETSEAHDQNLHLLLDQ